MAREVGIAASYYSQLENGIRFNPELLTLAGIARALGCTVGYLLGETEIGPEWEAVVREAEEKGVTPEFLRGVIAMTEGKRK